jgi:hypothetical protein
MVVACGCQAALHPLSWTDLLPMNMAASSSSNSRSHQARVWTAPRHQLSSCSPVSAWGRGMVVGCGCQEALHPLSWTDLLSMSMAVSSSGNSNSRCKGNERAGRQCTSSCHTSTATLCCPSSSSTAYRPSSTTPSPPCRRRMLLLHGVLVVLQGVTRVTLEHCHVSSSSSPCSQSLA